jgi:hypothetical protein
VFTLLALLTLPALAQTPEPTAVATPDATAQASATPEAEATDAAPVIEVTIEAPTDSVSTGAYDSMLDNLTIIFLALLGTVGAVGGVGIWRAIGILLIVVEVWAKFTDSKTDDIEVAKWRKAYDEKMMAQAAKDGAKAAVTDAMAEERAKLTAQVINAEEEREGTSKPTILPPHNPVI